jgi:hypothetical protein
MQKFAEIQIGMNNSLIVPILSYYDKRINYFHYFRTDINSEIDESDIIMSLEQSDVKFNTLTQLYERID